MKLIYDNGDLEVTLIKKEKKCFNVVKIVKEKENLYKIMSANININSSNIDKCEIETYIGMENEFDAEEFAIACLDYYGNKFWGGSVGYFNAEETEKFIINNLDKDE